MRVGTFFESPDLVLYEWQQQLVYTETRYILGLQKIRKKKFFCSMDVTGRASKFKRSLNLDLFLKHGTFFSQRSDIFFLLKLLFIKTERMCFKNVIAPTNREKKIITYFLIVHPRGTHAEISQTTKKIGGEILPHS